MYPSLHIQSTFSRLPTGEDGWISHDKHAADPVLFLYVPAAHAQQLVGGLPVYLALHPHCNDPGSENSLAAHMVHAAAPGAALNLPARHSSLLSWPDVSRA